MTSRSITILAIVTLALVALAAGAIALQRLTGTPADQLPDRLFRDLASDRIAAIEIQQRGESLRIERRGTAWVLAPSGYPVRVQPIADLVDALRDISPIEAKTNRPDLYPRLNVQDPAPDNPAARIRLLDDAGTALADLILGDRPAGGSFTARYARRADQPQAWLVASAPDPRTDPTLWVDREITRIERERVRSLTVQPHEGAAYTVTSTPPANPTDPSDPSDPTDPSTPAPDPLGSFQLSPIPEGRAAAEPWVVSAGLGALAFLDLRDVRRADTITARDQPATATFALDSGVVLTVHSWLTAGQVWLTLDAAAPATQADPAHGDSATPADAKPADPAPADAGVTGAAGEAARLNARLAGWAYQVPDYAAEGLRRSLEDLLAPPAPQAPPPALPPAPDMGTEPTEPTDPTEP